MALVKADNLSASMRGFGSLPIARQLGLMIGLAASIALVVAVWSWTQNPSYRLLYSDLSDKDAMEISDALQKTGIPFQIVGTGTVMVPADRVHDARMKLASQSLPKGTAAGFDKLDQESGFGTSEFVQLSRHQRALEAELARTSASLSNVDTARVHLAVPKQSAFLRDRKPVSASVLVALASGRSLDDGQVTAIVHMVASSVPSLDAEHVTVIDQKGTLLTSPHQTEGMAVSGNQFEHRKKLEEYYIQRIESLLSPIVGQGGVRAQVSADLDFSMTEQTQESFNPDLPAIRSEQTVDEQMAGSRAASGIPGALTNQPPAAGTITPPLSAQGSDQSPISSNRRAVRNYELDRTISHTRLASGSVQRLSVAVVVDDHIATNKKGETTRTPLKEDESNRITGLIKEAVGFNVQRGDSVSVINSSFATPAPVELLPEPGLLEQPWFWDVAKKASLVAAALFVFFMVLRPMLKSLAEKGVALPKSSVGGIALQDMSDDQLRLTGQRQQLAGPSSYEQNLTTAKGMVAQDAKRVAQVVKTWVATDG